MFLIVYHPSIVDPEIYPLRILNSSRRTSNGQLEFGGPPKTYLLSGSFTKNPRQEPRGVKPCFTSPPMKWANKWHSIRFNLTLNDDIQNFSWSFRGTRRTRWCISVLKVTYQFQISCRCNSYSECATLGAATAVTL